MHYISYSQLLGFQSCASEIVVKMGCGSLKVFVALLLVLNSTQGNPSQDSDFHVDSNKDSLELSPVVSIQDKAFEEVQNEEISEFNSRLGETNENARGIFTYKTKSQRVFKTVGHGPPGHHHNRFQSVHPVHNPPPFIHGHRRPHHHNPHGWPRPKKVPHYVKYWKQNHANHHHVSKKGWKMEKPNPLSRGYFIDLASRLADGIGFLPEYGNEEHHSHHHDNKHKYKGITLHNGFFTEVI